MLSVAKEIQVVSHVDPTRIRFGENAFGSARLAIAKIQRQFRLHARHRFETQTFSVRKPLSANEVFEWFLDLHPDCFRAFQFRNAQAHTRVRTTRSRISLSNDSRREGRDVSEVTEIDL